MKNFVVYRSGAGSGKTFTLVKEYLRLALHDETRLQQNYKRILAVTFTNKAAAEMKSRVISALDELAGKPELSDTGRILCAELAVDETEIRKRASVVLTHLLHHYSDFAIGTIDSFTHKIVRTFAQELDLPVNFNVELNAASFYEKVVAQLLSRVGEDEQVSRLLKEYVLNRAEDNAAWDPEQGMNEFAALLVKENSDEYLEKLAAIDLPTLERIHRQLLDFIAYYRDTLKTKGRQALELLASRHLTDEDFIYKSGGPQSFFRKCARGEAVADDAKGSRLLSAIDKNKWHGKGVSEKTVMEITPQLNSLATELIDFVETNYSYYSLCELLSKQMYGLMLLRKIEEIGRQQKEEERIVFISEFNSRIYQLINEEPAPFIYERLGERYHHFLLDEFQDTSSLQFQNLLPLLDNSLANGWYNLVVGDGKQSIYRWRNANVRQFANLPLLEKSVANQFMAERQNALKRNFDEKVLDTNYRSSGTIVEFNNALFGHLRQLVASDELRSIYAGHTQKMKRDTQGYITVNSGSMTQEELEDLNLSLVTSYIRMALHDGYSYSDICVLCRKNSHGNLVASELVKQGVPVVSSDSLLLNNNLEVNTILCYLRHLVNPSDTVSAAAVLTYLFHNKKIDTLQFDTMLKKITGGSPLAGVLRETGIHTTPGDRLNNISDHCLNIIRALHMHEHAHQYIRFFLDEVNEFLVTKNPNISSFLEWWESRKTNASLVIPDNTNAVRIMTIHASKGLEFPVVIIPYCNWPVHRSVQTWVHVNHQKIALPVGVIPLTKKAEESGFEKETEKEKEEQLLDSLNLLYVGLTRAADRMHLICAKSKGQHGELVCDWITGYLEKNGQKVRDGFFDTGKRNQKADRKKRKEQEIFELAPLQFNEQHDLVKIKNTYALYNSSIQKEAQQYGLLLHHLLSHIDASEDIEKVVNRAFADGLFTQQEGALIADKLHDILNLDELRDCFGKEIISYRERELATADGEILRPDRVILKEGQAVIIDYKSGAEDLKKHGEQLRGYEKSLAGMGHKNVKKLLVYLEMPKVVEVK